MINCAHPPISTLSSTRTRPGPSGSRACGRTPRPCSHAELDEATELDDGDPADLGERYADLREKLPRLNVLGGCCGTDSRHVPRSATAGWRAAGRS